MTAPRGGDSLSRGAAVGLLSEAMILPTGILSAALLTRTVGLDIYGLIGVSMAVTSQIAWLATSVLGLRSNVKIVTDAPDQMAAASALLRWNFALGLAAGVTFALAAPWIAELLTQPQIITVLRLGALEIILMPVARAHRDALLATTRFSRAGLAGGLFHLARLAAIIALLILGFGLETVICAHIAGRIVEIAWCRRSMPIPLFLSYRLNTRANFRLVWPTFVNAISIRVADALDLLVLSALGVVTATLGHYSAAIMFAQLPRMLNLVIAPALIVTQSRIRKSGSTAEAAALRNDTSRLMAVFTTLIFVAIGAGPTILRIIFGDPFVDGTAILRILLSGGVGIMVFGLTSAEFVAENRPWTPACISASMVVLNAVLLFVLIPPLGAEGAALASALAFTASGIASLALMQKGAADRARLLIFGILAGCGGGGVAWALAAIPLMGLDIAAGCATGAAILFLTGALDRQALARFYHSVVLRRG